MLFLDSMTQSAYKQITDPSHQHHHPVPAVTLVYNSVDMIQVDMIQLSK